MAVGRFEQVPTVPGVAISARDFCNYLTELADVLRAFIGEAGAAGNDDLVDALYNFQQEIRADVNAVREIIAKFSTAQQN